MATIKQGKYEITPKIGLRGGMSIYGLSRYPVTVYREQAEALFHADTAEKLRAWIEDNAQAMAEQEERFAAAEAVADTKGITEPKAREAFIRKILDMPESGSAKGKSSARADLVDKLMKKANG